MEKNVERQLELFMRTLTGLVETHYQTRFPNLDVPKMTLSKGRKYAKIVKESNQRTVHSFVDLSNGDILMAATFNAPAKHARGNIFDNNCGVGTAVSAYGANYLR
jgi:hypothetical protein